MGEGYGFSSAPAGGAAKVGIGMLVLKILLRFAWKYGGTRYREFYLTHIQPHL